jgi:hypothetical protein
MSENLEGGSGKVDNVPSGKSDSPTIGTDYGESYNTTAAMQTLERNRAMYEFDRTAVRAHNQVPEPVTEPPGSVPFAGTSSDTA